MRFRQIVVGYAEESAAHGVVYLEGIFTPAERVSGGASWDEVFAGFCDGATEAREQHGVEVDGRLTSRGGFPLDAALETARNAVKYRDRGVVGLGLGGLEAGNPPEPYERAFRIAKDGGLGSVPHAGEGDGVASIRARSTCCRPTASGTGSSPWRTRPSSVSSRTGIVCDVCPVSNLRTQGGHRPRVASAAGDGCSRVRLLDQYRRPRHVRDRPDPDYEAAAGLGVPASAAFDAGVWCAVRRHHAGVAPGDRLDVLARTRRRLTVPRRRSAQELRNAVQHFPANLTVGPTDALFGGSMKGTDAWSPVRVRH